MKLIYGKHLLIDGYVNDPSVLAPDSIVAFFDSLVKVLGMEYLQRPMAVKVPLDEDADEQQDDGGWSYFCQITTSHIAIHTWPLRSAFMMDVFSCRDFDEEQAKLLVFAELDTNRVSVRLIERNDPHT